MARLDTLEGCLQSVSPTELINQESKCFHSNFATVSLGMEARHLALWMMGSEALKWGDQNLL